MKKFSKVVLFLSSYIPLFIILIILNLNTEGIKNTAIYLSKKGVSLNNFKYLIYTWTLSDFFIFFIAAISIVSLIVLWILISQVKQYNEDIIFSELKTKDKEILEYLLVYILSFINSNFSDFSKLNIKVLVAFLLLIFTIGYLYIINNMLYINPIIHFFFRYRIYEIKISNSNCILLSKKSYNELNRYVNLNLTVHPLSTKIYLLD